MPFDPTEVLGEVLGRPATKGFDPVAHNYLCPFLKTECTKRSTSLGKEPYPLCSVRRNIEHESKQICVCPKRFYSVNFLNDVVSKCWPGEPPTKPLIASEVKMTGFGNVDFVIADEAQDGGISQFLSVELQAVDISGSVMPAYKALRANKDLDHRPTYGMNFGNVYKRFVTQLIRKGYYHHHWGSKVVAVVQDVFYDYIQSWAEFLCSENVKRSTVNIIFMTYRYKDDPDRPGVQELVLDTVEGTSHANLQQAVLYKEAPSRDAFCEQIKRSLVRSEGLYQPFGP